jgi:hypothetical protein
VVLGVALLACSGFAPWASHALAQAHDAQPSAPPAEVAAPAAAPTDARPGGQGAANAIDAKIAALEQRIAEQEKALAQQREELQATKARLGGQAGPEQPGSASEPTADAQLGGEATEAEERFTPSVRLYGFADAGIQRSWGGLFNSGLALSDATNFVLGNVNVYFDASPLEHFRFLTEVRFTTLPNGAESFSSTSGSMQRQDTGVQDQTSTAGGFTTIHWGGIVLERAQIEWTPTDAFNLRVGYFLTPYGIWNVDHGSPTRIMLRPPFFVSVELMPERQTGVDLFGVFHALPWDIGYDLYVSNGRTIGTVDFSDDKALGGRVYFRTRRPFPMQFGGSFFRGTTQDYAKAPGVDAMGRAILARTETVAFNELDGGLDASLDLESLRIRAEVIFKRVVFEPGKRAITYGIANANVTDSGGYLMLAYRLPWLGLEPLLIGEFLRFPSAAFGDVFLVPSGGVNVYINSAVTVRTQYSYAYAVKVRSATRDYSNNYLHVLAARLIIAF